MDDNLKARYYCLTLRTACLLIGYAGLIVYPIMMIAYALIEIKLLGANVPAPSVRIFLTTAYHTLVVFMSGLMNMGIYSNNRNLIIKSLYFYLIFLFWCLIRIVEGVMYVNILQLIIFIILLNIRCTGRQ
ncbi:uncharacterized protein isoform X2 [Rhodnius prolixus]|uniref:uncharacterized protein isoform X2 n=1 Tax=Rhodnius prolixus TaxID=13249 RepID=UPI003D18D5FF